MKQASPRRLNVLQINKTLNVCCKRRSTKHDNQSGMRDFSDFWSLLGTIHLPMSWADVLPQERGTQCSRDSIASTVIYVIGKTVWILSALTGTDMARGRAT